MALEIDGLSKRFGAVQALDDVSFSVESGRGVRLPGRERGRQDHHDAHRAGPHAARRGHRHLAGRAARSWPRRTWGYMPEERGLYLRMKVIDQLVHFAALYGVRRKCPRGGARVAHRFRIADLAERPAETPLEGQPAEGPVHRHVLQQPDVLLMDEPFIGLDPVNVAILRAAFLGCVTGARRWCSPPISSDQAQALCDSVAIIDHGRIVASGTTREVRRSTGQRAVRLATSADDEPAGSRRCPGVTVTSDANDFRAAGGRRHRPPGDPPGRPRARRGGPDVRGGDPSLEDVFVERVGAASSARSEPWRPLGSRA